MPDRVMSITYKAGPRNIKEYPEAASQTFKKGDPVILSSGKVAIAGTSSNLVNASTTLGFAEHDASGTTDNPVKVLIPSDDTEFVATFSNGTSTTTWAVTYAGTAYDLRANSSITSGATGFSVDRAATGNAHALVVGVVPGTLNDPYPRVVFRIPTAKRTLGA